MSGPARPEILTRVEAAFARAIPNASFSTDLAQADCPEWTSLKHVQLMLALEKEFGLRFDGASVASLSSIEKVVDEVSSRLSKT